MSPTAIMTRENDEDELESQYQKGVKQLRDKGLKKIPRKYILPIQERPNSFQEISGKDKQNLELPIIDFAELQGSNRNQVLKSLSDACQQYGFFQVINHGIPNDVISGMIDASKRFFELPLEERSKYMSSDMTALVRYGTSFNQNKDKVFCWRDFLKLMSHPLSDVLPHWPSSPPDFRKLVATYTKETKYLFLMIMEAILEGLSPSSSPLKNKRENEEDEEEVMEEFKNGSQLMIVNMFPECPEPELTLGMPPHSDYGFLTLLLQDDVEGLQIQYKDKWLTVQPIPNAFVVNVGDHLEIFSNGRYKSVLHRVKVNSTKSRISVASLHTLPFNHMVKPWLKLIDEAHPRRYEDTNFYTFLDYISSREPKNKEFLESRKLI
ncbi:2-oxoglutarate (2OG) and Fe(II)-dependent oxygenase superfamily protein [Euphorbia peplus]|nr:2-oxoglutarate (2OG) and Fe(II)-dependent oxygenase superfamily protein [Euphorbia peplus]